MLVTQKRDVYLSNSLPNMYIYLKYSPTLSLLTFFILMRAIHSLTSYDLHSRTVSLRTGYAKPFYAQKVQESYLVTLSAFMCGRLFSMSSRCDLLFCECLRLPNQDKTILGRSKKKWRIMQLVLASNGE